MPSFATDIATWITQGKIKTKEEIVVGMDNAPEALVGTCKEDKFGKLVNKVHENYNFGA